ncbi:fibrocystin-L-like [Caerostris extrusa]|uniref:Fibrocystin-L-like n=1 Tax=Caerostris extrusa TaxID=172846 RepID=A0AAV4Y5G8_CAEEX|nr:fibrocystin-L-like [Caerostris extrusa]
MDSYIYYLNIFVEDFETDLIISLKDYNQIQQSEVLQGISKSNFKNGQALFSNISFLKTGNNFKISISAADSSGVQPWFSDSITVTERSLFLQPASRRFPISPRENDTFSPAAGVIIHDALNNAPADTKYLSKYTWEGTIGLLYDDVYPGQVLGTTTQRVEKGSNEVLFHDVVLSDWGYSYILKISMRAKETTFWNLTCLIGPFDVDILDTFEMPLIESEEYRQLKIIFDGNFKAIKADQRKFEIFFLNHFGRKYPQVRWKNLTVSEGSVVVVHNYRV